LFTPLSTFEGTSVFTYRVVDNTSGLIDTAKVFVKVFIVNIPVDAIDDIPAAANSGLNQTINVKTNDLDPNGTLPTSTVVISTNPKRGMATVDASGNITYTPNGGVTGKDTLYYRICEPTPACGVANCDIASVIFTMINRTPTASAPNQNALPCSNNTFNLLTDSSDPEGGVLSVSNLSALSNPAAGGLVNNNDGTVTFVPATGFTGSVTFSYTVTDNGITPKTSPAVTITIMVANPPNTAPIALNDNSIGNMDAVLYVNVSDNDTDPDGNILTNPTIVTQPLHGMATVLANGLVVYTPHTGFFGSDVLTYRVCDIINNNPATCSNSPGLCTTAMLFIQIDIPPGNFTNANNDQNSTWQDVNVSGNVMTNDTDLEGDTQNFAGFLTAAGLPVLSGSLPVFAADGVTPAGTLIINANGTYTFDPLPNFIGTVTIPYLITDTPTAAVAPANDRAYLTITVIPTTPTNSVIANNDENITYGTPVSASLFVNDADPQAHAFTVTDFDIDSNGDGIIDTDGTPGTLITIGGISTVGTPTSNAGTLVINANGTYTFTPAPDFHGVVDATYQICDTGSPVACATAYLHIDVLPDLNGAANDPPFAGDDFSITKSNTPVLGNFIANDTDPNANPISLNGVTILASGPATPIGAPVTTASGGTIQFYANGTYLYTPAFGFFGTDNIVYQVCDITAVLPNPLCSNATISVQVGVGISLSGQVWDDNDTSVAINNGENATNTGNPLYMNILDAAGNVLGSSLVAANGAYTFPHIAENTSYTLVLTSVAGTPGLPIVPSLPNNWVNTGQNANGVITTTPTGTINLVTGTTNITNANFGIEQRPFANNNTAPNQANPGGTISATVAATTFSGSDNDGNVASILIATFPTNATSITINGTLYTAATFPTLGITVPTNAAGNPLQTIAIDPIDGATIVEITYYTIDNAGVYRCYLL
jgi:large repetitive protein